ncbi:MAG TPA: putative sugar nucleotidyl transferase [Gemmataceae bacterium]
MRVCLFEDDRVIDLEPLTLSRPAFELRCGITSLAHKQRRHFAAGEVGMFVRPYLEDLCRARYPEAAVNDWEWLKRGPVVLVNARWLPPAGAAPPDLSLPHLGLAGAQVAYAALSAEQLRCCELHGLVCCLEQWKETLPGRPAGGTVVNRLWELIDRNAEQIRLDFEDEPRPGVGRRSRRVGLVGPKERLCIDPTARIDPMVVADTTDGPVVVARGAVVQAFTRLEGPCYVGPGTRLYAARVRAGTTLGPECRVGGEVEASIVQGFGNKYHDGFLGHSYLGEWVNLGAGTQTSDLRNDYGEVSVTVNGARVPTGRRKVGTFAGDHAKVGLGALLNTGSNLGPFAHLLPSGELLPRFVPPFAQVLHGRLADAADPEALFAAAGVVMARRGRRFTPEMARLFRHLFEATAGLRRQAAREAEQHRLRRSA